MCILLLFGRGRSLGEKAIAESNDSSSTVFNSNGIYITPVICQTPLDIIQTSPDTPRHHPDTLDIGVFAYEKALEEKAIAESTDSSSILFHFMWHLYYPRHLPHTLRHNPDTPRHHPDTPDIGVFAYEKALEEKAIAESKDSSSTALNSYK